MNITLEQLKSLLNWYAVYQRELPWRNTKNPYDVWLSEIMLQQTRVEAVKEKFKEFKNTLPTITALANTDEDTLRYLWNGLGYYNRCNNLHKCAIVLKNNYNSTLPSTRKELLSLPGIGPYTSGAIASIAFNQPCPAVDGNVLRILARLFNDPSDIKDEKTKKKYEHILETAYVSYKDDLLQHNPNAFRDVSQAFMDLGATVCIPNGQPHCKHCCFQKDCLSHINNTTDTIPFKSKNKKRRIEDRTILLIHDQNYAYIQKRPAKGLLASLYEFVNFDHHASKEEVQQFMQDHHFTITSITKIKDAKHIFSHIEWHMVAYDIEVSQIHLLTHDGKSLDLKEFQEWPMPSAFSIYKTYLCKRLKPIE